MDGERARRRATGAAVTLAVAVLIVGVADRTGAASGADSYGYLSQAELWRGGSLADLKIEQPFVRELPWPNRAWTAAPLGYRPSDLRGAEPDDGAIVPTYSPGLPGLLALAKRVGGQAAALWVVPIFGALLVLTTYRIGARMVATSAGLAAAFLVAMSPAFLFMLLWPMTDVPVAACWALATLALFGEGRARALAAGCSAALAILIRPNLIWIGVLAGLWIVARDLAERPRRFDRAALFALGVLPAIVAVMAFNDALYGSPLVSGYGRFSDFLRVDRLPVNVRHYSAALSWSQTPLAFLGVLPLALPVRAMWREHSRDAALLTAVAAGTLACYLFYLPFHEWWYLRFLLPIWPGLFIGLAWLLYRAGGGRFRWWAAAAVLALGVYGGWFALARGLTHVARDERRYIVAADLVREETPPNSVIFAMQHSGSVRYYGERMTLRYDNLPPEWLDRAVAFLAGRGAHPYILLEDWEIPEFTGRFASAGAIGRLEVGTVFELQQPGHIFLFDPLAPMTDGWPRLRRIITAADDRSVPPREPPSLSLLDMHK